MKKIPYGVSDFEKIRRNNYYYVDKTNFIEKIEDSSDYLFFIRPRRFGKSLFLSLMENYYDINKKEDFEQLFKGTYIYDNPTEEKNKYLILKFNFSEVNPHIKEVENSFNNTIRLEALRFIQKYKDFISDTDSDMHKTIKDIKEASEILKHIIKFTKDKGKIYLLIDEYDNFTNTIISSVGNEQYTAITHGQGFYRHFFNVIKAGTTGGPIAKLFITGVSPVTMDDVTSGFNIGDNITSDPAVNQMVGFTETEVIELLKHYEINERVIEIMKPWYNNYLFSQDEQTKIFNSDMALYFVKEYLKTNKLPKEMLNHNIKIDYKKLKYLIITDIKGRIRVNGNFEKLKMIIEQGEIIAKIVSAFPVDRIIDTENFISLLYYFGLLTIKGEHYERVKLIIPNEAIKQLHYDYIREGYRDTNIFTLNFFKLGDLYDRMAYNGNWEDLFLYLSEEMTKQTALRDYIKGEKEIQTFLRVYMGVTNYYITKSEAELYKGFCDIMVIPNIAQFPDIKYSYLMEIKYIKPSDYDEKKLEEKISSAKKQLEKYKEDETLKKMIGNTKLERIILVFAGVELKYKSTF